MKKLKKIKSLKITIKLRSGMHIGGLKESLKIGGADSPIIREFVEVEENEFRELPIIPGSSLKGKLRSLLELTDDEIEDIKTKINDLSDEAKKEYRKVGENYIKYKEKSIIPKLFGLGGEDNKEEEIAIPRLIVRDLKPTKPTIEWWDEQEEVIDGGIIKGENSINRLTSAANPRQIERVPAGSEFEGELLLLIFEGDPEEELEKKINNALNLLKNSYLGGSGTRGYGEVEINKGKWEVVWKEKGESNEESDS